MEEREDGAYELRSRNERAFALSFRHGGVVGPDWWGSGSASGHERGGEGLEGERR